MNLKKNLQLTFYKSEGNEIINIMKLHSIGCSLNIVICNLLGIVRIFKILVLILKFY